MTDITDHLKTVREALDSMGCDDPMCFKHSGKHEVLASLATIEAELNEADAEIEKLSKRHTKVCDRNWGTCTCERLEHERDEAVAALRRVESITHTGVMHCPVVSGIGSPCTCGIKTLERVRLGRLSTPQEPTDD